MTGFRARLGFLLPPGNPTIEPEMMAMAPEGVSLHFHRMVARGIAGSLDGQAERNRSMVAHLDESIEMLALVNPDIIVIAPPRRATTSARMRRRRCSPGWRRRAARG